MGLVGIEDRGAIRHIVMERSQKRNALNEELVGALGEAFREAAADSAVRVLVIRGAGPMFSSGMDVGSLSALAEHPGELRPFRREALAVYNLLEEIPKPTICQIHGACLGGALELALAADLRVMAEDAVTGLLETRIGLVPDLGGCSRLPALVGTGIAKELIMTGRVIDGSEAHRIGLANRIAPPDRLDEAVQGLCDELLACAPVAMGLAKRVIDAAAKPALSLTLEQEVQAQQLCAGSEDFAEGTRAFMERRDPQFSGR
ncbi:MAG: enoyl-CoA hydratase-related protein [Thermoleophilaceae bacterium]